MFNSNYLIIIYTFSSLSIDEIRTTKLIYDVLKDDNPAAYTFYYILKLHSLVYLRRFGDTVIRRWGLNLLSIDLEMRVLPTALFIHVRYLV